MSMYTHLLDAAWKEHPGTSETGIDQTPDGALEQLRLRRHQLVEGLQAGESAEMVPAQLALEVAYDVALMDLARCNGIEAEPGRFEQPLMERERLEQELRARGFGIEPVPDGEQPVANHR